MLKKTENIHIKVAAEQKLEIQNLAHKSGLSLSSYMLYASLNYKPNQTK